MERGGESGSHAGETGDEERAKRPLGCDGRLKVERDRGARGVCEAISCGWANGAGRSSRGSTVERDESRLASDKN
jgi:hypothetical protein